ncbi:S16 family serine protease [Paenibacillus tarimensis]
MRKNTARPFRGMWRSALFAAVLMIFLLYIPTPFAAVEPGIAEPVTSMVKVAAGDPPGQGVFMLTTVRMSFANYLTVASSIWKKDLVLFRKKDILGGKSQAEYAERLVYVMQNSQSNAVEAAYRQLGIHYRLQPQRLVVTDVSPQLENGTFRAGDVLVSLNAHEVKDAASAAGLLMKHPPDEPLRLVVLRQGERASFEHRLVQPVTDAAGKDMPKALGGVQLTEIRNVVPDNEAHEVTIAAGEIGGPSAGIMFALQTIDYLTPGDLANGRKVAGTGTIGTDGRIGPIGSISLKVMAAHDKGAELFLAPRENVQEAREAAALIGTNMRIEPVETLAQALEVLGTP